MVDTSRNYLAWNNTEAITYTVHRSTGADIAYSVATAKRRPLSIKERLASGGAYLGLDRVWLIPAALLAPTPTPGLPSLLMPGDFLTDSEGVIWTVLEASFQTLKSVWRLICRDLVLAWGLRDSVDLQRATVTTDAAGAPVRAWPDNNASGITAGGSVPYGQVPARVQLLTQQEAVARGIRGLQAAYSVIVGQAVVVTAEDRVKVLSGPHQGLYLKIEGLRNPERIDELPILDCVQLP
jgi:head-tail adaptor